MFSFKAGRVFEYSEGIPEVICPASRIYSSPKNVVMHLWARSLECHCGQEDGSPSLEVRVRREQTGLSHTHSLRYEVKLCRKRDEKNEFYINYIWIIQ